MPALRGARVDADFGRDVASLGCDRRGLSRVYNLGLLNTREGLCWRSGQPHAHTVESEAQSAPDIIIYNAPIDYEGFYKLLDICRSAKSERVVLLLTTEGGSPHAGYRIGRCLRETYRHVTAFVTSWCKSAGTLVVLAADEIVIDDTGELGPLDVQLRNKEELDAQWSGNDLVQGLLHATQHSLAAFRGAFLDICMGADLTAKLGADVATKLVTGLYCKIFEQIDPSRLGEVQRANQIGLEYGTRLASMANSASTEVLRKLVLGYPAHGFVIDRAEAETLFRKVRAPDPAEQTLARQLVSQLREPLHDGEAIVKRIYPPEDDEDEALKPGSGDVDSDAQQGAGSGSVSDTVRHDRGDADLGAPEPDEGHGSGDVDGGPSDRPAESSK
jgi:hypothetical protein